MRRALLWGPLLAFALFFAVVASGLIRPADRTVRSQLVGKPLPTFTLPPLAPGKPGLSSADFRKGQPRLLNIFASWCIPCAAEAPQLMRLKAMGIAVDAVAIRDTAPALTAFLRRNGDPYQRIGDDKQSAVQLALGSSGVPETFVIDGQGKIVLQHVGDIRAEDVDGIAAAVRSAR
ncbi:DsbE family thiol:disulfide interchange protein [Sphingomonas sp. MA1305]|uniref:DsbE family thiol:disulfide interchange protein n=1 Tax=Sphingomonas sp. MA1305 TaxID=2479204 RepID=UPI0018E05A36|nr:DsbE family thiol:disulfide interchange protein [Sphingomonas sp. MA1305]MBI0474488.1 DsbE family thiol:disulfide interchange protein [Sphingomonas sp. MA1305]